jgi:hypothetical protein
MESLQAAHLRNIVSYTLEAPLRHVGVLVCLSEPCGTVFHKDIQWEPALEISR